MTVEVNLIDYTGAGSQDPLYAARKLAYIKNTRLEQGPATRERFAKMSAQQIVAELEEIANTIRSSWEFVTYTFEVRGVTRAYTHQQVRTRFGIAFAQQAQRVADMGKFEVLKPQTIKDAGLGDRFDHLMRLTQIFYQEAQAAGVPNQDCRSVLPTNVLTNIIMEPNLRTLADLIAKRENLRAQGEYADVIRECIVRVKEVHPWVEPFLHPDRLATPALDQMMKETLGDRSPVDVPLINKALKEIDKLKGVWG